MQVLWLCNIILPEVARKENRPEIPVGGWIEGLSASLRKFTDVSLIVCSPAGHIKAPLKGSTDNMDYCLFPANHLFEYSMGTEKIFIRLLEEFRPDIVHIFGTEFPHTLAMVNACEKLGMLNKMIVQIQGLCVPYCKHYYAGVPGGVIHGFSFRDILKKDNLYLQRNKLIKRGEMEAKAIQKAKHIIGRTDWDRAYTYQTNPKAKYYHCNEILRDAFYSDTKWDIENCERFSVFLSQGGYPIKGLHYALEALEIVLKEFPATRLYVAGHDITDKSTLKKRLKRTRYGVYIGKLLEEKGLREHVTFLGTLNELQMRDRFLRSHVFVSPSSIENESNSLSEAKIMGVPSVASYVGGVTNRILHGVDGFSYQHDAAYMLAYYICEIFRNDKLALELSENSKASAKKTNDRKKNAETCLAVYKEVSSQ